MKQKIFFIIFLLTSCMNFAIADIIPSQYYEGGSAGILKLNICYEKRLIGKLSFLTGFGFGEKFHLNKVPYYGNAFFADIFDNV